MNKNKKSTILSVITVITLVILLVGATYAYFQVQGNTNASADVRVTTYTTDVLSFETGDAINIYADQSNFASGLDSLSDSSFAKASLLANNKTNEATDNYYIYLYIPDNSFVYTQEDNTPELLLQVTDLNGNVVTSIDGLEYKTVIDGNGNEIKGFDITTKLGMHTIVSNQKIEAKPEKIDTWNFSVVFVNLDADQKANMGKTFKSQLIISKDNYEEYTPAMVNTINTSFDNSNLTVSINADAGTEGINKYYYAIKETNEVAMNDSKVVKLASKLANNDFEYIESSKSSYTFTNTNENSSYHVYAYVVDNKNITSNVYISKINNDASVLPKIENVEVTDTTNTSITIKVTATKGTNEISKYYYSIGNEDNYIESESNTYTFTNLIKNNDYKIKIKVSDTENKESYVYELNEGIDYLTIAKFVKSKHNNEQGSNGIYLHNSSLANGAGDNSYRYAGADVDNYVCFGSTASSCPEDNLYRIIGVFDGQAKLIKADYAKTNLLGTDNDYSGIYSDTTTYYKENSSNLASIGTYYWNKASSSSTKVVTGRYDVWGGSELNTYHLNDKYLGTLGTWTNMIATTTWPANALATTDVLPAVLYNNEIVKPTKSSTTYAKNEIQKIGLMSVSDYAFAASPSAWTTTPYNYEGNDASGNKITDINWLYMGLKEWTLANCQDSNMYAYNIGTKGFVGYSPVNSYAYAVRPVFYLDKDVYIESGDGTKNKPLTLKISN